MPCAQQSHHAEGGLAASHESTDASHATCVKAVDVEQAREAGLTCTEQ